MISSLIGSQIGAAIGSEFFLSLPSAVAELSTDKLQEALGELVRSELVFCRGEPPQAVYTFKHALVQDAAYGMRCEPNANSSMPASLRR